MCCESTQNELKNIVSYDSPFFRAADILKAELSVTCKLNSGALTHTSRMLYSESELAERKRWNQEDWEIAKTRGERFLRKVNEIKLRIQK